MKKRNVVQIILLIIFTQLAINMVAATPVHRLYSNGYYYVAFEDGYIVRYSVNVPRDYMILSDTLDNFDGKKPVRILAVPNDSYILVLTQPEATTMPIYKRGMLARDSWYKLYEGVGADSAFAYQVIGDDIVMALAGQTNLLKLSCTQTRNPITQLGPLDFSSENNNKN